MGTDHCNTKGVRVGRQKSSRIHARNYLLHAGEGACHARYTPRRVDGETLRCTVRQAYAARNLAEGERNQQDDSHEGLERKPLTTTTDGSSQAGFVML